MDVLTLRYNGFLDTPVLWRSNSIFDLHQFEIDRVYHTPKIDIDPKLRLGKYVERFVSHQLQQCKNTSIIAENIQVLDNKQTIGELDCLLLKNKKPVHLEIVYKFYVYDPNVGNNEISHCIGPNRKDSLVEKLTKLKRKQLPLLHTEACKPYLDTLNLNAETISQQVYFKAQLFMPYRRYYKLKLLNDACIAGYYISRSNFDEFDKCKFFIPTKKDWLITPHTHVDWMSFNVTNLAIASDMEKQYAVMLWVKHNTGVIEKVFLVWW